MIDKDLLQWFPMRVTYSRGMKIKAGLDLLGINSYIPMEMKLLNFQWQLVPAIENLIFIHASYNELSSLKRTREDFEPLRYMMHPVISGGVERMESIIVPDRQMDDFIHVSSVHDKQVFFMRNLEYACKPGDHVQVTDGVFAGVKGIIKRVRKNECVVVPIKDVAAVAIQNLPRKFLRYISDDEWNEET